MASLDDIVTTMKNAVVAIGNLNKTVNTVFPQTGGITTSATGGSATLPANPVGFVAITLPNGTSVKVPYYD